jgi:large subunit ribosomal protein L15
MPLQRRLPKFGFTNPFRKEFEEVQVADLDLLPAGEVTIAGLKAAGLVRKNGNVVVLGKGEVKNAYSVKVHRVTAGAREAIEKAGGKVEILPAPGKLDKAAAKAKKAEQGAKKQ